MSDLSNVTINGEPQTWQQLYEREATEHRRAQLWAILVSDLDRCEHGRHEGDICNGCDGPSRGNPLLAPGTVIGHGLGAEPIVVPGREDRRRVEAWRA